MRATRTKGSWHRGGADRVLRSSDDALLNKIERDQAKALKRAASYLGAVEVAPGRYAFRFPRRLWPALTVDDTATRYFIATAELVCEADCKYGGFKGIGAMRHIEYFASKMPDWWTPERRYAVLDINAGKVVPDAVLRRSPLAYQGVTVDLETGNLIVADLTNVPRSEIYGAE